MPGAKKGIKRKNKCRPQRKQHSQSKQLGPPRTNPEIEELCAKMYHRMCDLIGEERANLWGAPDPQLDDF